jgi:hypothetical protein
VLQPLASVADAADFGLTVTESALRRASARIRGHVRQQITYGVSTVVLPESDRRLPERPVVSVASVVDEDGTALAAGEWTLAGDRIDTSRAGRLAVAYTHGLAVLPDEVIELVCSMAHRLGSIPAQLVAGTQQEGAGPWQHTYGFDSHKAASGLTAGEKEVLARYWPRVPRTISLGSPAG